MNNMRLFPSTALQVGAGSTWLWTSSFGNAWVTDREEILSS
jgi:hypothetical protein